MKNISLFQVIFIGAFVVLAGVGLFVFGSYSGGSDTVNTIGPVTVWGTLPSSALTKALDASIATNPSLKGVTYIEKQSSSFISDFIFAL